MPGFRSALTVTFAFSLLACAHSRPSAQQWGFDQPCSAKLQRSSQAQGLLDFLNDPATDMGVLDDDAALDRRAASNLVAFKLGPDGLVDTVDDRSFRTVCEADGVKWVGPATLLQLAGYARQRGYPRRVEQAAGSWEGVAFTRDEAKRTLALVNRSSSVSLDDRVPLDKRAVRSIIEARPIASIEELADLYFVGPHALASLKGYAAY